MLRSGLAGNMAVLSCEQLYMRYVDARANGTDEALFHDLSEDLRAVRSVRLIHTSWLSDEDLKRHVDVVLSKFRVNGGRIEH
jgi:hypothetical protein